MKNFKLITIGLIGLTLIGCASSQPQPQLKPSKQAKELKTIEAFVKNKKTAPLRKVSKFVNKPLNITEVNKILLKTNSLYAKKYKKEALKEKINLTPNTPLYRPPLFAEMIVFPYVSDGIYHDTQKIWIKIKNGEFVLNQNKKDKKLIFGINYGGKYNE